MKRRTNFNSRPSARGDARRWRTFPQSERFQFTPLREGRRRGCADAGTDSQFQFTPLREGRQPPFLTKKTGTYFNSRPSARGDQSSIIKGLQVSSNFNSRPSARGDQAYSLIETGKRISIHAPPRGATLYQGETGGNIVNFNSRPSARGDVGLVMPRMPSLLFQFTPLREGRRQLKSTCTAATIFQFTPLREGRRFAMQPKSSATLFQFTPLREGRRGERCDCGCSQTISIHAPPRGATW